MKDRSIKSQMFSVHNLHKCIHVYFMINFGNNFILVSLLGVITKKKEYNWIKESLEITNLKFSIWLFLDFALFSKNRLVLALSD